MVLYSSSQHSLESVFGEAELVCYFTHPGGKIVCMSVIARSTPGETASSRFFNGFVPYAENGGVVTMGKSWSLLDVVPDVPSYYIYKGTTVWPNCTPNVTWIVYSNTVSMDPSDYAKLVKTIKPARRPLEEVADRKVTFFDAQARGVSTPRDGKLYLRCRRAGKKKTPEEEAIKDLKSVKQGGLEEQVDGLGVQQVEFPAGPRNHVVEAKPVQFPANGASRQAAVPRDVDLVCCSHGVGVMPWGGKVRSAEG
jgi:hypothetical protein